MSHRFIRSCSLMAGGVAALAMAVPLQADPVTYTWVGSGGAVNNVANDIRHAGNWDLNGLPRNGDIGVIGGGATAVTAYIHRSQDVTNPYVNGANPGAGTSNDVNPARLHDPDTETPPSAIRILNNGTLLIDNNTVVSELNIEVRGGALMGAGTNAVSNGTISLFGDALTGGGGRWNGLVQDGDALNPGRLIVQATGGSLFAIQGNNNTYTGGTVVQSGATVISNLSDVGSYGYGDIEILAGGFFRNQSTVGVLRGDGVFVVHGGGELAFRRNGVDDVLAKDGALFYIQESNFTQSGNIALEGQAILQRVASHDGNSRWSGVISDGDAPGGLLIRSSDPNVAQGTGQVVLAGNNTYTAGTEIASTRVLADAANALGTGDVTLHANANALLVLAHNDAINASAALTLLEATGVHGTVQLNSVDITVATLKLGDTSLVGGTYNVGDTALGSYFTGTGSVTVVPEPASLALLSLGALMVGVRRRRTV